MKNFQIFMRDYKVLLIVVIIFILTIIFLAAYFFIALGGSPSFTLFHNTRYSNNFSIKRFNSIQINDTKEQVAKKIGSPIGTKEILDGELLYYSNLKDGAYAGKFGLIKIYRIFLIDNKVQIIINEKGVYNDWNIGIQ